MHHIKKSVLKWLLVCAACLAFGFAIGKFKLDVVSELSEELKTDVARLNDTNAALDHQNGLLVIADISQQTKIKSLAKANQALNETVTELTNKVFFYERIISPETAKHGVYVSSFDVTFNKETKKWDYELVLAQAQKGRRYLKGKYEISFSYFKGDDKELRHISLKKLDKKAGSVFKFKYFQTVLSSVTIPDDINIDEVTITLKVPGSRWNRAQKISETFEWRILTDQNPEKLDEFDEIPLNNNALDNEKIKDKTKKNKK